MDTQKTEAKQKKERKVNPRKKEMTIARKRARELVDDMIVKVNEMFPEGGPSEKKYLMRLCQKKLKETSPKA